MHIVGQGWGKDTYKKILLQSIIQSVPQDHNIVELTPKGRREEEKVCRVRQGTRLSQRGHLSETRGVDRDAQHPRGG